jgi:hypothetical protein
MEMSNNAETAVPAAAPSSCSSCYAIPKESSPLGPGSWVARTTTPPKRTTAVMPRLSRSSSILSGFSYRGLLEVRFLVHRPDLDEATVGSLYRSEIFCTSPEQRRVAEEMIRDVDASNHWLGKTVTEVSEAVVFWEMAPEDQDYLLRFPHGCTPPFPGQDVRAEDRPAFA